MLAYKEHLRKCQSPIQAITNQKSKQAKREYFLNEDKTIELEGGEAQHNGLHICF